MEGMIMKYESVKNYGVIEITPDEFLKAVDHNCSRSFKQAIISSSNFDDVALASVLENIECLYYEGFDDHYLDISRVKRVFDREKVIQELDSDSEEWAFEIALRHNLDEILEGKIDWDNDFFIPLWIIHDVVFLWDYIVEKYEVD